MKTQISSSSPGLVLTRPGARVDAIGKQRGVVLLFALMALIAMSMAGIAFMRSVDTAGLMTGNLAFTRASVSVSDVGLESARTQVTLLDNGNATCANTLNCVSWVSNPAGVQCTNASGNLTSRWYWANWQAFGDNFRDYDWSNACQLPLPPPAPPIAPGADGYFVRFIVHRMCANDGNPVGNNCVSGLFNLTGGGSKGSVDYQSINVQPDASTAQPFYRVTIRVTGPRNAESYIVSWML